MDTHDTRPIHTAMAPLTYITSGNGQPLTLNEPYHSILLWIGEYWYVLAILLYMLVQYWKEKNLI